MEFGALANPALMDRPEFQARMRLPEDAPHTRKRLEWLAGKVGDSSRTSPKLLTGCPVWNHPEWIGTVYPPKTSAKDALKNYSEQFTAIELNTTYYGTPEEETILRWKSEALTGAAQAERGFTFCPKLPRLISHDRMLVGTRAATETFTSRMRGLGEMLGPCWLQLPPGFSPRQIGDLERWLSEEWMPFASASNPTIRLGVEFRHPDWFRSGSLIDEVIRVLESHACAAIITDTPGRRDVLHTTLTAPWTFIRYTGNQRHSFDRRRLEDWVERLDAWFSSGLKGALVFVHEPGEEHIPATVNDWIALANERLAGHGVRLDPWKAVPKADPSLKDDQLALF